MGAAYIWLNPATAISGGNKTLLMQSRPWFQADFTIAVLPYVT